MSPFLHLVPRCVMGVVHSAGLLVVVASPMALSPQMHQAREERMARLRQPLVIDTSSGARAPVYRSSDPLYAAIPEDMALRSSSFSSRSGSRWI